MYEKPELNLVGDVPAVVLGPVNDPIDNDVMSLDIPAGLVCGLDDAN